MKTMKNNTIVFRILAVLLSLSLGVPGPVYALRAMTGEGAGLEELVSDLKKSNGQAEDLLRRADQIIALNRDRIKAGQEQSWDDFNALVNQAEALWQLPRPQPDDPRVVALDELRLRQMEMLMLRHVPPQWTPGDPLPPEASADLYGVLSKGAVFVRQNPKPIEVLARTARVHQAYAMMFLVSAGEMKDRASAHSVMVDSQVPWNESFGLLHELEMAEARKLQLKPGETGEDEPDELTARREQHYHRALAYALLKIAAIPPHARSTDLYEPSADALAIFLPGGLEVKTDLLERRRRAILNAISLYLRGRGDEAPGQIPPEMVEEALQGHPSTLMEFAVLAVDILSLSAESPDYKDSLHALSRGIRSSLEASDADYYRRLFGKRVQLRPPAPESAQLQGVLTYNEASRRWGRDTRPLPTYEDEENTMAPGGYFAVPPEGVVIPFGQYVLEAGGLRVIDSAAVKRQGAGEASARWYVLVALKNGWVFPEPVWDLREADDSTGTPSEGYGGPDHLTADSISLRLIPGIGILVRPVGGGTVYLEHVPAELRLEPLQQAFLGHLIEGMITQRNGHGEDWWARERLQDQLVYYQDASLGISLERKPARLVRMTRDGERQTIQNLALSSATLPDEGVEILAPNDVPWRLIRTDRDFSLVKPEAEREEELPNPEYSLMGNLGAVLAKGAWSPERLFSLAGPVEPGAMTRKIPIKVTDGSRMRSVEFRITAEGSLQIEMERESLFGLPETSRLLIRLAAFLAVSSDGPVYGPETPVAFLQGILTEAPAQSREDYERRFMAVTTLVHHPDLNVSFLLGRMDREPSATLRQKMVTGLVERHVSGLRYSPEDRYKVWIAMAGLLTLPGRTDANRYVRQAALQAFVRLTPEGNDITELAASPIKQTTFEGMRYEIFDTAAQVLARVQKRDSDPVLREEAVRYADLLRQQFKTGPRTTIPLQTGPNEDSIGGPVSGGLEERTRSRWDERSHLGIQG